MAEKVRKLIDDPNVSADKLIHLLSTDPAISAHIVKVANNVALSGGKSVDTLRAAVSRLGYRMLRNLVMTITMSKLFHADSPAINQQLKKLWERRREVAANNCVLALHQKHLKPEQARACRRGTRNTVRPAETVQVVRISARAASGFL